MTRAERKAVREMLVEAYCSGLHNRPSGLWDPREYVANFKKEIPAMFKSWGLRCERVPLSGATHYQDNSGDVDVYKKSGRDAPFVCEVKGRKKFPGYLAEWLGDNDILLLKGDRAEPMAILPMRVLKELLS